MPAILAAMPTLRRASIKKMLTPVQLAKLYAIVDIGSKIRGVCWLLNTIG